LFLFLDKRFNQKQKNQQAGIFSATISAAPARHLRNLYKKKEFAGDIATKPLFHRTVVFSAELL